MKPKTLYISFCANNETPADVSTERWNENDEIYVRLIDVLKWLKENAEDSLDDECFHTLDLTVRLREEFYKK